MPVEREKYWTSLYIPTEHMSAFEYHGPWWVSGYTDADDGELTIICAAVMAEDEVAAIQVLKAAFDEGTPLDGIRERFSSQKDWDGFPFADRFPRADWMQWPWPTQQEEA